MVLLFLLLVVLIVAAGFVLKSYNILRNQAETVKESLSNISVVTSKKVTLVNQLISIVQSYQESEKFVMLQVSSDSIQNMQQSSAANTVVADIGRMAQRFPELKANGQYNRLMDALQAAEQEVQNSRTIYNRNARIYNTARTSIPTVFYASVLGFGEAQYLSIGVSENADLRIQQTMLSDDAERVNVLIGKAGRKALSSAKAVAAQGISLSEKGVAAIPSQSSTSSERKASAHCPSCGSPVIASAAFCGDCGTRLPVAAPVTP